MLNNCANEGCKREFNYFGEGKLFLRDQSAVFMMSRSEMMTQCYWLCPECASRYKLEFTDEGIALVALEGEAA